MISQDYLGFWVSLTDKELLRNTTNDVTCPINGSETSQGPVHCNVSLETSASNYSDVTMHLRQNLSYRLVGFSVPG